MEKYNLELINKRKEIEIKPIKNCNEYTSKYGLILTDKQIKNMIEGKNEILKDKGRVEFRESIIDKIIKEFCDSPYIFQHNYAEILYELTAIFYEYKNETLDLISDNQLILFMKKAFNEICQGDLEYLSGTVMYHMKENLLMGKPLNYIEKEEEEFE